MLGIMFVVSMSIGLPILMLIYAFITKRSIPFLLGVLAFVVSQVFIRIPIVEYMQLHSTTYSMWSITQPVLLAVIIGLSAGVFEEMARFILMRFLMKQRQWKDGFLFGAGHGGIEAVLLVGISAFTMLFAPISEGYNVDFLIAGTERFFAMLLHIGLSIIVLQGVLQKKFMYIILAILIHGFVDALVGVLPLYLSQNTALIAMEMTVAITALAVFGYSLFIKRKGVLP